MTKYMHFEGPDFQMEVPTDWYITSSNQFQAVFVAPGAGHVIDSNFAISLQRVKAGVTARAVGDAAKEQQMTSFQAYEILSESAGSLGPERQWNRRYRWRNSEKEISVVQVQRFNVINSVLFTITLTRPDDDGLVEIDAIFDHMIQSIRIGEMR